MTKLTNEEMIRLGYDRYSLTECAADPHAAYLAAVFEGAPSHNPPDYVKEVFRDRVEMLYAAIPLRIIPCAEEPYFSSEQMQKDVKDNNRLLVRHRVTGNVGGHHAQHWRTVHDYYGHVLNHAPFNLRGEIAAFSFHVNQFPRIAWPYIWNNVVLENAYRLNRGHFLCMGLKCSSKNIFDTEHFGDTDSDHWYRANV